MNHRITIETHRMSEGDYRADGVRAPWWSTGLLARASARDLAFMGARIHAESLAPFAGDTFSYLHVES